MAEVRGIIKNKQKTRDRAIMAVSGAINRQKMTISGAINCQILAISGVINSQKGQQILYPQSESKGKLAHCLIIAF